MSRRLVQRTEKQKVMIVFSDGEPAAEGYVEEGILDTYEAVLEARRSGTEVISVYLADGEITDSTRQTFRNIYGGYNVVVPDVSELSAHLTPLLRKILLKHVK
jgi:nitric oxide reductase activation protein